MEAPIHLNHLAEGSYKNVKCADFTNSTPLPLLILQESLYVKIEHIQVRSSSSQLMFIMSVNWKLFLLKSNILSDVSICGVSIPKTPAAAKTHRVHRLEPSPNLQTQMGVPSGHVQKCQKCTSDFWKCLSDTWDLNYEICIHASQICGFHKGLHVSTCLHALDNNS